MRVLIAGCGYLGTALGEELAADGDEVFGLRRRADRLPRILRAIAGDLADPSTLRGLPRELDAVVYAAAADAGREDAYRAAYVDGLRHLLRALEGQGPQPRRVLFTSSTAVYGQEDGSWVDESSPTEPADFRGRLLLEGEALLARSGLPATALRLGGIYGPGRTRLIELVRAGRAVLPPGPPRYGNRIQRDDAAGILRHLLHLPAAAPLYLGVDCEPASQAEVLRWLSERLGAPPPRVEAGAEAGGRGSKRCRNDRIRASGYRFRYPTFREGYGALIEGGASPH